MKRLTNFSALVSGAGRGAATTACMNGMPEDLRGMGTGEWKKDKGRPVGTCGAVLSMSNETVAAAV